jgi:hypothetical protein
MPDPETAKLATIHNATWYQLLLAALGGGFLNPVGKYLFNKYWPWSKANKKLPENKTDNLAIAELHKDERTEDKLWQRVEDLETKITKESEDRVDCERAQNELRRAMDEEKRDRIYLFSKYVHLTKLVNNAFKEIEYLKTKLREKDPDFDVAYPDFYHGASDNVKDEDIALVDKIVQDFESKL